MAKKNKSLTKGYKVSGQSSTSSPSNQPKRPPLTHFLCIPLVTEASKPQLQDSLDRFKNAIELQLADRGNTPLISPKAIRPIGTIHLTLGVMSLTSEEHLGAAIALLKSLDLRHLINESVTSSESQSHEAPKDKEAVSKPNNPIRISLTSLISMHAPTSTSILYTAPQDTSDRLYPLCSKLRALFEAKGHLLPDDRPLKLHATIVNTIYAKSSGGRTRRPSPASKVAGTSEATNDGKLLVADRSGAKSSQLRFDATTLLEDYRDYTWAKDLQIEKLAICKMGASKVIGAQGDVVGEEYDEVASIAMP